ncbi:F-box-like domain-containing protein [Legionella drozanskii]|uniref:Ankyrin repeats (3 copies) n=1 Tax=Legionella drozanskii LLAP-1 TaxID=1212489 RepID=A0A0W0SR86_9GAMM|nr:F-box-like domain-containing protein [Legionella drozanskii]KTC85872.1 Ankyrin repeats (3 copies) [Legionella drozanskii LLAP-1]
MRTKYSFIQKTPPSVPQEYIELPEEIWVRIFSLIDPESLLGKVQLTSKLFYRLANDYWVWEKLFNLFFSEDLPAPLPSTFDWRTVFITLYREQYGSLSPQTCKYIFLIAIGAIQDIRAAMIPLQHLEADQFILIKTAARFKRQAILNYFYSQVLEQLIIRGYKDHLYWATLCNQHEAIDSLLKIKPDLINAAIFEENKTVTMLAALVGHLELMKKLIIIPNNNLLALGFTELYHFVVRNGQRYMVEGFNSFIKEHEANNSTPLSFRIKNAARNLPSTISIAAIYGSIAIFKSSIIPLHHECIQLQNYLESESSSATTEDLDESKALQLSTESKIKPTPKESYEQAKANFDWVMLVAMMGASEHGHVNIIKYVLDNNFFEIEEPIIGQNTLLFRAVEHNQLELVIFLLKKQADPEFTLTSLLSGTMGLEEVDYSEIIFLLVKAIEKRNKFNPPLIKAAIDSNRTDILERLLAIDPQILNKTKGAPLFLCQAITLGNQACVSILLDHGVEIDVDSVLVALRNKDLELVQELLNRADPQNISELVKSLNINKEIKKLLSQKCDITDLRNLIDFNDQVLKRPPIDKNHVLALAKQKKKKLIAAELCIEIELEHEAKLGEASLSNEDLIVEQLTIQLRAKGLQRGSDYVARHVTNKGSAHPKRIRFPCSTLEGLAAFKRLTATDSPKALALERQLREVYLQSYKKGLAQENAKRAEVQRSKRKAEHTETQQSKKRPVQTSQNNEETEEQSEKQPETKKRFLGKRKSTEPTNQIKQEERKSPKLADHDSPNPQPSTGRFGLFTNSNRETAVAATQTTTAVTYSDVEEPQTLSISAQARRSSALFFAPPQLTSPDSETEDLTLKSMDPGK